MKIQFNFFSVVDSINDSPNCGECDAAEGTFLEIVWEGKALHICQLCVERLFEVFKRAKQEANVQGYLHELIWR
jgi:hypothetical protein